jgi:hypothetical protein
MDLREQEATGAVRDQTPQPPAVDDKPKQSIPRAGEEHFVCDVPKPGPPWVYT